jgi:hypothetical protein
VSQSWVEQAFMPADFGANIVGFSRCGNQAGIEIQQLLQSCFQAQRIKNEF